MSRFQESKVIVDQEPAKIIRLQPMAPPFCLGTRSPEAEKTWPAPINVSRHYLDARPLHPPESIPRICGISDPSNFLAISSRTSATGSPAWQQTPRRPRALHPRRWAISANVVFSESESSNRPLIFPRRMRFSSARYSFLSRSSWSTVPVMYANIRARSSTSFPRFHGTRILPALELGKTECTSEKRRSSKSSPVISLRGARMSFLAIRVSQKLCVCY